MSRLVTLNLVDVPSATIFVRREPGHWVDRARRYKVVLDDREVDRLKPGEHTLLPVEPGAHTVFLKIDWGRSPTLSLQLAPEEAVHLVCGPNANPLNGLWFATFGRGNYIRLHTE